MTSKLHVASYQPFLDKLGLTTSDTERKVTEKQLSTIINKCSWSFECCIDGDIMREEFENFLQRTQTQESWIFCRAVEDYSRLKSDKSRYRIASEIVSKFIVVGAEMEINVGEKERQDVLIRFAQSGWKTCPCDLFDAIAFNILAQLKIDCFARFVASKEFQRGIKRKISMFGVAQTLFLLDGMPLNSVVAVTTNNDDALHQQKRHSASNGLALSSAVRNSSFSSVVSEEAGDEVSLDSDELVTLGNSALDILAANPNLLSHFQAAVIQPNISRVESRLLVQKFVKTKESCSMLNIGSFHYQRTKHLFNPRFEAVFWSDSVVLDSINTEMQLSKHKFHVSSARNVEAWHLTRHLPFSLEEVMLVMLSGEGKEATDNNIYGQKVLRYHSTLATVQARLSELSKTSNPKAQDFDEAISFSGPITVEMFKLKWPIKDRRATILSAPIRDEENSNRILVIRQSVSEASVEKSKAIAQIDVLGGYLFETENGGGTRTGEFKALNFNTMLPTKQLVELVKERSAKSHTKLSALLNSWHGNTSKKEHITRSDQWYMAIQRALEENAKILQAVNDAKKKYFKS